MTFGPFGATSYNFPPSQTNEEKVLDLMRKHREEGVTAGEVGVLLWPDRKGRIVSSNGGGDYAAQMLLGRMRKKGLVRTLITEGSSRWGLA